MTHREPCASFIGEETCSLSRGQSDLVKIRKHHPGQDRGNVGAGADKGR